MCARSVDERVGTPHSSRKRVREGGSGNDPRHSYGEEDGDEGLQWMGSGGRWVAKRPMVVSSLASLSSTDEDPHGEKQQHTRIREQPEEQERNMTRHMSSSSSSLAKSWGVYARSNATLRECHFLRMVRHGQPPPPPHSPSS